MTIYYFYNYAASSVPATKAVFERFEKIKLENFYKTAQVKSENECQQACQEELACRAVSFNQISKACLLFTSDQAIRYPNSNFISYVFKGSFYREISLFIKIIS
jgi:hypothetical protein